MQEYSIYTLSDPRDNSVRYVGITINIKQRKSGHLCTTSKSNPDRNRWIENLKQLGTEPVFTVIDHATGLAEAQTKEQRWISVYQVRGYQLLNMSVLGGKQTSSIEQAPGLTQL